MIAKLATLAREIREVIPGTTSITVQPSGNLLVQVGSDDDVHAFATEHAVEVDSHEFGGSRWISAVVRVDAISIAVMGPHAEIEQEAA